MKTEGGAHSSRVERGLLGGGLLVLALLACSGCSPYTQRRDTIALSAGDAVNVNSVSHVIDPWPRHSRKREIEFRGDRLQPSIARYRSGGTGAAPEPRAAASSSAATPSGSNAASTNAGERP